MATSVPRDILIVGKELVLAWEDGREDYIALEKLRRTGRATKLRPYASN